MSILTATQLECLPCQELELLNTICDRFEESWKESGRPSIEDFLAQVPRGELRGLLTQELIGLEAYYRVRQGEILDIEEYAARFPAMERSVLEPALRHARNSCSSFPCSKALRLRSIA